MELTFVNQYSGAAPKRRRLAQACTICRQRKKRCIHCAGTNDLDSSQVDEAESTFPIEHAANTGAIQRDAARPAAPRTRALRNTASIPTTGAQDEAQPSSQTSRAFFMSDLVPESTLLDRPAPSPNRTRRQPNDDIGVWVDRREWDALVSRRDHNPDARRVDPDSDPHLDPASIAPLLDVYFDKIHPILPIVNEQRFRADHAVNKVPEVLVQAMCLVAAKDPSAQPLLAFSDDSELVPPRQICKVLHQSITRTLSSPPRLEKVTLIKVLALTSLHTQGIEGSEEASIVLSQAMHHAQTLGLHLGNQGNAPVGKEAEIKRLFWCLWALDRCNAASNGRPVIMSDIDIAIDTFAPGESGFPAFEAWLEVAQLLNRTLDFYRPTSDTSGTGWEGEWPGLEEIIDRVGGWDLAPSLLATIHLFYLGVGILSHRTRGFREIPRGLSSSVRQRLCAIEIVRLLTAPDAPILHPMPVLPYAVSLSLSVSYQHLRQSQLVHQQADAREDFRTCCRLLQSLRRTWCSADVMATLGEKVLARLDRAPSLASFRIPRSYTQRGPREAVVDQDGLPPPTACAYDVDGAAPGVLEEDAQRNGEVEGELVAAGDPPGGAAIQDGVDLYNMDDVFGTFMDPNCPLNLDDMSFATGFDSTDWNASTISRT